MKYMHTNSTDGKKYQLISFNPYPLEPQNI